MTDERMRILEMIEQGTITAEEGADLINALEELDLQAEEAVEADYEAFEPDPTLSEKPAWEDTPMEPLPDMTKWRNYWYIPLAIGVVITGISGLLVYAGNQGSWHWFWMVCVWMPLLFGIFLTVASWLSRTARWLHVRVNTGEDEWPRRIAISFPLPIGITAFGMKLFGRYIPGMENVPLDEAVMAIKDSTNPDSPLYVEVDSPDGEHVQVYIG
jgi:hypothetical protein